ncbi:hypothetical protein Vretimale_241 [Volvox reticuliferus]|uniref:Protein kinase domain-containing protein n=1 Tax=Volvox reticuliferus TaxID=1737510 RepID=A0A8J4D2W2_9CHLO|nr:hypothetical protein Vretifemale_8238 [Volvox reticuliferus]GIL93960.1 hypothetical protein Vretimale_241 [Volvox reticuliferus]
MASEDDELPQKLDLRNLQVHELLGESGYASYWRTAFNGQEIVLKVLKPKLKSAPARPGTVTAADGAGKTPLDEDLNSKIFLREAEIAMQLEHKHIVRCFGVTQLPGGFVPNQASAALATAMELCGRQSMKELILRSMAAGGRRVYKIVEAYKWLAQLSSALAYLHSRKPAVLHRDIRPDTVMFKRCPNGDMICKLSDFGLHVVLYEDRSNVVRRRAFTQTIVNPLADRYGSNYGDVSQSTSSISEASPSRLACNSAGALTGSPATARDSSSLGSGAAAIDSSSFARAGLGTLNSLLKQLDLQELKPLRPDELERIYNMPEKADSFLYMAPEVFNNLPSTERSDVFSFGVLAYEVLAGELLSISIFNTARASKMGIYNQQGYASKVAGGFRPSRLLAVPCAAWALIESCWHQDPMQRPTMPQVHAELQRLIAEIEGGGGVTPWVGSAKDAAKARKSSAKSPRRDSAFDDAPTCTEQCVIS